MHDCLLSESVTSNVMGRELDCFFTKEAVVLQCLGYLRRQVDVSRHQLWLEPAAGTGAFLRHLPRPRLGMDIMPSSTPEVKQGDFLTWLPSESQANIITIGNPPFGKNASLAVRFFNHAAQFSHRIAMILPRTFRKESIVNRLDRRFHLEGELPIPDNSFEFNGQSYSVPTVFQIWTRQAYRRQVWSAPKTHPHFVFTDRQQADFAVQRVGVRAGAVKPAMAAISPNSHYFLKAQSPRVAEIFGAIDWTPIKHDTAGNPSLSKADVVKMYVRELGGSDG